MNLQNSTQNAAKVAISEFQNGKNFWGGDLPPPHTPLPRRLDTHTFGTRTTTFLFQKKALSKEHPVYKVY